MDMYFLFVPMAVYVDEIVSLKQFCIFQYHIGLPELDYFLFMAKNINQIGYFLNDMQVMSGSNNRFP